MLSVHEIVLKFITCSWDQKKWNYELTNSVFTCLCYKFFLAVLPEVEVLILTKNCNFQHFKFKKTGFVDSWFRGFVVSFFLCQERHIMNQNIKCGGMMDSRLKNGICFKCYAIFWLNWWYRRSIWWLPTFTYQILSLSTWQQSLHKLKEDRICIVWNSWLPLD